MAPSDDDRRADGKRYEPLARQALDAYAMDVASLTLIAWGWNYTFEVRTTGGQFFALRVYLPNRRSDDEVRTELAWLEALSNGQVVPVPRPIRSAAGSMFEWVRHDDLPGARRVAVFSWVPGEPLGNDPAPSHVSMFGQGVARLHAHGSGFRPVSGLQRLDTFLPGDHREIFAARNIDVVRPASRAVFERAERAARAALERLEASAAARQIVHGDLHQENVFVHDADVWFIDFDDCLLAWPAQDLGVTMWEVGEDEATWAYRDALREGYEQVGSWPERWPGELDVFAAARGLRKADDVVADRAARGDNAVRASLDRHARAIEWFLERSAAVPG
jgi:Ser/Thr protein kinase RdoA (MazF antagonist)